MKDYTDLIARLRESYVSTGASYVQEAADTIERLHNRLLKERYYLVETSKNDASAITALQAENDRLRAKLAAARDAALEEAAQVCERSGAHPSSLWETAVWAQCCEVNAEEIRALKGKRDDA